MNRIFLAWPTISDEMKQEASRVLTEEKLVNGESVFKFEEEFSNFIGSDYAISTSSGTTALILIQNHLLPQKSNIITTSHSFIATAYSSLLAGHDLVFSDIDLTTGNIDLNSIQSSYLENSDAILPVHLHGHPVDFDSIKEKADKHNLKIIEDAAQAHGAKYKGKTVGSLGDAAAFSFYSTKNMTVGGDGGMITTNDANLAKKIESVKDNGRVEGEKYIHDTLGQTARLNTVNAAIGRIQLKELPLYNNRRQEIAKLYDNAFKDHDKIKVSEVLDDTESVYHLYPILINNRDEFVSNMKEQKIECGLNYPLPIPEQPYFKNLNPEGVWTKANEWASKVVVLPIHYSLTNDDVKRVIDATLDYLDK